MSRTIRRKSGDRWFAKKQARWELTGRYRSYEVRTTVRSSNGFTWDYVVDPTYYRIVWEDIKVRPEFDKKLEAEWTRDKYLSTPWSQDLKWHSNLISRADQREQLHLIMRGQEHYDDSYELKLTKGLAWIYD